MWISDQTVTSTSIPLKPLPPNPRTPFPSTPTQRNHRQAEILAGNESADDDYYVGDDPKAGAGKKMKRAFCEPGNADVNPPLAIARDVAIEFFGSLNVGDKVR